MGKRKEKMTMDIMYKKEAREADKLRVKQMLMLIKANYSDIIKKVNQSQSLIVQNIMGKMDQIILMKKTMMTNKQRYTEKMIKEN